MEADRTWSGCECAWGCPPRWRLSWSCPRPREAPQARCQTPQRGCPPPRGAENQKIQWEQWKNGTTYLTTSSPPQMGRSSEAGWPSSDQCYPGTDEVAWANQRASDQQNDWQSEMDRRWKKYITRHYRVNPTNCGERHCIIPADYQEERGKPQRLCLDVSATCLPGVCNFHSEREVSRHLANARVVDLKKFAQNEISRIFFYFRE